VVEGSVVMVRSSEFFSGSCVGQLAATHCVDADEVIQAEGAVAGGWISRR